MSRDADLERRLDELYAAAPASFTRTRDAIARELRDAGEAGAADAVRKRHKPTQGAWVLNQLARRHPDAVAALVDVGRALLREQRKVLRGESSTSLRDLLARQRSVLADVARRAAGVMTELGIDPSGHLDDVTRALQAALVDPEVGVRLEQGRLEKAPEPTGRTPFDVTSAEEEEGRPRPRLRAVHDREAEARKARDAREAKEREAARRARQRAITAARTKLRAAEAEARRRRDAADRARTEADASERAAEEVRRELARLSAGS